MDDNIVWIDPKGENVGKVIPFKNTNMSKLPNFISNQSIGFIGNDSIEVEEGSYVVLDTDFLMYKEQFEEQNHISPMMLKYLEEYQEKRKK